MMRESIEQSAAQLLFKPSIVHEGEWKGVAPYVLAGMGGSALPADVWNIWHPREHFFIHSDYGLPKYPERYSLVTSSYSGNTEETLDAFEKALGAGMPVIAVTTGGELLRRAKERGTPYIQIPTGDIQPRMSTGYFLCALAAATGAKDALGELNALGSVFDPRACESEGNRVAQALEGTLPLVYASRRNYALGRIWKIKLNETGKTPSFWHVFPELNHNEMTGFDGVFDAKIFHVVMLRDSEDHPRIQKRMDILERLLAERGIHTTHVSVEGATRLERVMRTISVGDWTALHLAEKTGVEPEEVPMVESFKTMLNN